MNENVGPLGTAGFGYAFGNGLRTEFEFGYRANSAKNITLPAGGTTPTSLNLKANAAALSYMVNGLYDFSLGSSWTPYHRHRTHRHIGQRAIQSASVRASCRGCAAGARHWQRARQSDPHRGSRTVRTRRPTGDTVNEPRNRRVLITEISTGY